MGPTEIAGLPAHVLLVHATIVLVPLTGLALVVCAIWPEAARRLGPTLPILALVTLVSVPLATHAGEWLEHHVEDGPLVHRHAELGDTMLPWALGLFAVAAGVWFAAHRARPGTGWAAAVPLRIVSVVLSVAVAAGSLWTVYRIGDSGARAAWHDGFSKSAVHGRR